MGYAPNVVPPAWLSVTQSTVESPTGQFDLPVIVAPTSQAIGTYSSSLRFLTGRLSNGTSRFIDVPIQLSIQPPPPVYTGVVLFSATTIDTNAPAQQVIPLDFGIYTNPTFTVTVQDGNSVANPWLTVTSSVANRSIGIAVAGGKPVGTYKASLIVHYHASGATGTSTIPIQYDVTAGAPQVNYVVPNAIYRNVATDVIVRGAGFSLSTVQSVSIGAASATFNVVNDTQINARFPAMTVAGSQALLVQMTNGAQSVTYPVVVKQPPPAIAGNIDIGEASSKARFDSLHDAIIVAGRKRCFVSR